MAQNAMDIVTPAQPGQSNQPLAAGLSLDSTPAAGLLESDRPMPMQAPPMRAVWSPLRRVLVGGAAAFVLVAIGGIIALLGREAPATTLQTGSFNTVQIPLDKLSGAEAASVQTLAVNGRLVANNSLVIAPSTQPASAVAGQLYYDQVTNQLAYYNGSAFVGLLGGGDTTVQNTTNTTTNITNITTADVLGGSGTAGSITKFTGTRSLGNSIMTDTGTSINVNGNINLIDPPTSVPEVSIWPTNPIPAVENQADAHAPPDVELGVRFRSDVDGVITGIRFYKGTSNTGTHTGSLWSSSGGLLATATFTNETASGWQEVRFSSPVAISADTTYVASYHTAAGFYSITDSFFDDGSVDNTPLHALQDGVDGANGLFRYSLTPAFPDSSFNTTNYWVDVLFRPGTNISKYQINGAQISSADLINNADLAKRGVSQTFTGTNTFRKNTDGTIAFNVQNAAGANLFSVDSLNGRVYIGTQGGSNAGTVLVLGVKNNAGDPAGVEGAMYFSDTLKAYRCYRDGAWSDCSDLNPERGFSLYDDFLGGQATDGNIGNLGWSVHTIGGASTIGYNPATPTPVADRPGVLSIQTPAAASQGSSLTLATSDGPSLLMQSGNTVKAGVAVGSATDQVLRVGLHTQTTGSSQPLSGVWWEANPSTDVDWQYCYGDGATATCTPSAVLVTANSWVRLEIRITATGAGTSAVTFVINGAQINVSGVTIDTTNRVAPALSCLATAGAARNCYWDYYQIRGPSSAAR